MAMTTEKAPEGGYCTACNTAWALCRCLEQGPTHNTFYSVNLWGSHPDDDNDDCWSGNDFATLKEAEAAFAAEDGDDCTTHVELGLYERTYEGSVQVKILQVKRTTQAGKIERRRAREEARADSEWQRERAMQAGMEFGIHGYNDVMGADSEEVY